MMLQITYSPCWTVPSDLKPHESRWQCIAQDGPVQRDGDWEWVNIKVIGWVRG